MVLRVISIFTKQLYRNFSISYTNMSKLKAALIQMNVGKDRTLNLEHANNLIKQAKQAGAKLVVLPECFNSPYGTNFFDDYAELFDDGPTTAMLRKAATDNQIYIVGGTFPERDGKKLYNTCSVWNPKGILLAKYRKMHLFDIDIPGGITFKESDILSAGNELATFVIDDFKVGVGICYDIRFEELAKLYRKENCSLLVYPAAFNMTTGPLHWELLQRSRANDNQLYVFAISPARGEKGYIAWGHSQATDPWGRVIAKAGSSEEVLLCDLDLDECTKVRQQIPIFSQRRTDVYDTQRKSA